MDMRYEKTSLPRTGLLARVDVSSSAGLSHTWVELIYPDARFHESVEAGK